MVDAARIAELGWRQGAVLGPALKAEVQTFAPFGVRVLESDLLIVVSHDCDIVNPNADNEPVVEILRASAVAGKPTKMQLAGRNPRVIQLVAGELILTCKVHERWSVARGLLASERPAQTLAKTDTRLIAEWLAKRYIRPAFPTAFDSRWSGQKRKWLKLLEEHSESIQGVYLLLNSDDELDDSDAYVCDLLVAVPKALVGSEGWAKLKDQLESEIEVFWNSHQGIECAGVEARGTDEISLDDLMIYSRLDIDWLSFSDGTASVRPSADMLR